MLGLTILHCNMLMLDLSKYKCYRMKYRLHMGTAHMACDPKGGAIMAQEVKVVLKGDALEDARRAFQANREVRLDGRQSLLIEQEGGEVKHYSLGQYLIVPERVTLTFGKE